MLRFKRKGPRNHGISQTMSKLSSLFASPFLELRLPAALPVERLVRHGGHGALDCGVEWRGVRHCAIHAPQYSCLARSRDGLRLRDGGRRRVCADRRCDLDGAQAGCGSDAGSSRHGMDRGSWRNVVCRRAAGCDYDHLVDMAFPVTLCVLIGREVIAAGNRRNLPIVAIIALLATLNLFYHLGPQSSAAVSGGTCHSGIDHDYRRTHRAELSRPTGCAPAAMRGCRVRARCSMCRPSLRRWRMVSRSPWHRVAMWRVRSGAGRRACAWSATRAVARSGDDG